MTKIILTIVLGLSAATAVGMWYFSGLTTDMQSEAKPNVTNSTDTLSQVSSGQMKGKNSIMSLLKLGKSMECTFSFSSAGVRGEGSGFFSDGNARVDSLYTGTGSAPTASYMISDAKNKIMYTWTLMDGVAQGVKMVIPDNEPAPIPSDLAVTALPSDVGVTPETDVEYDCKSWAVDNSVFVPPSDVAFMDMTSMQAQMEDMQREMGSVPLPTSRQ